MTDWSLTTLLASLHDDIEGQLQRVRASVGHSGSKGDASENVWVDFLSAYLPKRYQAAKAFVVDSHDQFSQQIDVVVFDQGAPGGQPQTGLLPGRYAVCEPRNRHLSRAGIMCRRSMSAGQTDCQTSVRAR